jgi:hypothetical protein
MSRKMFGSLLVVSLLFVACSDDNATNPVAKTEYYGTFTITNNLDPVNGVPNTDAFNHLVNVPIDFSISFSSLTNEQTGETFDFPPEKYRRITTDEATFTFTGDPIAYLQKTVSPNFQGVFVTVDLTATTPTTVRIFENFVGTPGDEYFGFEISINYEGTLDTEGYPVVEDFSTDGTFILRRYTNDPSFRMTDFASGSITFSFRGSSRL